jgi:carbamoylphosphate synthase large subunit
MSRPRREHAVWIGAAGTRAAYGLVASIRAVWRDAVHVVAADTNPRHLVAASLLADDYVQVPPVADSGFRPMLLDKLDAFEVDAYLPILDEEIVLAAELRDGGHIGERVAVAAPPAPAAEACFDKLAAARWLEAAGLPAPATFAGKDAAWMPPRMIVKPRHGRGSAGVAEVTSPEALREAVGGGDELVVQDACSEPELTIDAFRARRGGRVRAVCRERLEVKAGVSTKARVFEDAELEELAGRVASCFELAGSFCIQVMRSANDGRWLITDVNPRCGAGTRLSAAVGVDFFAATVADLWNEETDRFLPRLDRERYVVREYVEFVLEP